MYLNMYFIDSTRLVVFYFSRSLAGLLHSYDVLKVSWLFYRTG
jgi:hypothetical protein